MALQFEEEMKSKLLEYKIVCEEMDKLKKAKDTIRDQAKKWIEMNNTDEAYLEDVTGQAWKINKTSVMRKRIDSWSLLKELVGNRKDEIFTEYNSDTFKIAKVKGIPIQG